MSLTSLLVQGCLASSLGFWHCLTGHHVCRKWAKELFDHLICKLSKDTAPLNHLTLPLPPVLMQRGLVVCRQAQLQQGHEDYQSVAKREQREQERRRADQARDAERKTREEVCTRHGMLYWP